MAQNVIIVIDGQDNLTQVAQKAAAALGSVGQAAQNAGQASSGLSGMFSGLASGLGGVATVAGGIVAANLFGKITEGIAGFVKTGLGAVGAQQQLEASLKALLTSNQMYAQSTEEVTTATTRQLMSQDEYQQRLSELNADLVTQQATYQEQAERIRQLTAQYGENGLVVIKNKAQHDELALAMQRTQQKIDGLSTSTTEYGTATKTGYKQIMNMGDAQKLAAKQSQELLRYISDLAVISPFETQDVESVTKYAIAAGMGVDETKAFARGFLDMASAVGIGSDSLGFAADQLLQVKKIGQLTTIDLRQLRRMGIDLEKIIGVEMAMSVDEFNDKAKKSPEVFDELFASITRFNANTFAGTMQEMATSVGGMGSTMSDIFTIGARTFLRPLVDAFSPAISEMIGELSNFVLGGDLESIGQQLADTLMVGFGEIMNIVNAFQISTNVGVQVLLANLGFGPESVRMITDWITQAKGAVTEVQTLFTNLSSVFSQGGFFGGVDAMGQNTSGLLDALGLTPDKLKADFGALLAAIPGALTGFITGISEFLKANWPVISASLQEWSVKFWDWAKDAAAGIGQGMMALSVALLAWATSPEASTAISGLGEQIGQMIYTAIGLHAEAGAGSTEVLGQLALGLLTAVGSITASLVMIGGELLAGIFVGIANSAGGEFQVQTISQLRTTLTNIGRDAAIIASYVGKQIVTGIQSGWNSLQTQFNAFISDGIEGWASIFTEYDWAALGQGVITGILEGINKNKDRVIEVLKDMAQDAWDSISSLWGSGSPATAFIPLGASITQGIVVGLNSQSGNLQSSLSNMFGLQNMSYSFREAEDRARRFADNFTSSWGETQETVIFDRFRRLTDVIGKDAALAMNPKDLAKQIWDIGGGGRGWGKIQDDTGSIWRVLQEWTGALQVANKDMLNEIAQSQMDNMTALSQGINDMTGFTTQAYEALQGQMSDLGNIAQEGGGMFQGTWLSAEQAMAEFNGTMQESMGIQQQMAASAGLNDFLQTQAEQMALNDRITAAGISMAGATTPDDLGFLGMQADLVNWVTSAGMAVSDVFGDFEFGLQASMPQLIQLFNDAVGQSALLYAQNQNTLLNGPGQTNSTTMNFNINSQQPSQSLLNDYQTIQALVMAG